MRIALLDTKPTPRSRHLLERFAAGVATFGDESFSVDPSDDLSVLDNADVAVQVCYPNVHHNGNKLALFRLKASARLKNAGKRVLTIDTGFVKSQPEAELALGFRVGDPLTYPVFDRDTYYSVGFDGLKGSGDYCSSDSPRDRWDKLETPLKPWQDAGPKGHIVLIGQPQFGLSTQHLDARAWYTEVAAALARSTKRAIVYRPHPRSSSLRVRAKKAAANLSSDLTALRPLSNRLKVSAHRLLRDDLRGAWALVTLTSNAAVEAAVAGIPVIACDGNCMAAPVAASDPTRVDDPHRPDRTKWAYRLAYSQWNPEEFRSGECWARLRPHAIKEDLS